LDPPIDGEIVMIFCRTSKVSWSQAARESKSIEDWAIFDR
jgi:hypothetical protein